MILCAMFLVACGKTDPPDVQTTPPTSESALPTSESTPPVEENIEETPYVPQLFVNTNAETAIIFGKWMNDRGEPMLEHGWWELDTEENCVIVCYPPRTFEFNTGSREADCCLLSAQDQRTSYGREILERTDWEVGKGYDLVDGVYQWCKFTVGEEGDHNAISFRNNYDYYKIEIKTDGAGTIIEVTEVE